MSDKKHDIIWRFNNKKGKWEKIYKKNGKERKNRDREK